MEEELIPCEDRGECGLCGEHFGSWEDLLKHTKENH